MSLKEKIRFLGTGQPWTFQPLKMCHYQAFAIINAPITIHLSQMPISKGLVRFPPGHNHQNTNLVPLTIVITLLLCCEKEIKPWSDVIQHDRGMNITSTAPANCMSFFWGRGSNPLETEKAT